RESWKQPALPCSSRGGPSYAACVNGSNSSRPRPRPGSHGSRTRWRIRIFICRLETSLIEENVYPAKRIAQRTKIEPLGSDLQYPSPQWRSPVMNEVRPVLGEAVETGFYEAERSPLAGL